MVFTSNIYRTTEHACAHGTQSSPVCGLTVLIPAPSSTCTSTCPLSSVPICDPTREMVSQKILFWSRFFNKISLSYALLSITPLLLDLEPITLFLTRGPFPMLGHMCYLHSPILGLTDLVY